MENRFENFTITILKLNKLVNKIKLHEMRGYDLRAVHVMCLHYLAENPSGLTSSELCKLTLEDKAAVSRALDLLKEKNFVACDSQKYNSVIRLTAEGAAVAAFIADKADKAVAAGGASLTDGERATFYRALTLISKDLEKYYAYISENNI